MLPPVEVTPRLLKALRYSMATDCAVRRSWFRGSAPWPELSALRTELLQHVIGRKACQGNLDAAPDYRPANLSGSGPVRSFLVQQRDVLDVGGGQLEVEDVDVLPDPVRGDRLGEHDVAPLDVPAQHDLSRGLARPRGD